MLPKEPDRLTRIVIKFTISPFLLYNHSLPPFVKIGVYTKIENFRMYTADCLSVCPFV